jgi:hypothetical protein
MAWIINSCHLSVMLHHSYTIYFAYASNLEDNEQFLFVQFLCLLCLGFFGVRLGFVPLVPSRFRWMAASYSSSHENRVDCLCALMYACLGKPATTLNYCIVTYMVYFFLFWSWLSVGKISLSWTLILDYLILYSLRSIILVAKMEMCLDTSILATSFMERREYEPTKRVPAELLH